MIRVSRPSADAASLAVVLTMCGGAAIGIIGADQGSWLLFVVGLVLIAAGAVGAVVLAVKP